ncbi:hypothetical protein PC114_g14955 [Phytophthora cactorum]|nr:hypothetical protein PC114_g14955 [Phytophthora cactorum]KAG3003105.1 hypothetical protein PC120_g19308 [Phytophthora cactorum]KAG3063809.1 hypothetical protein PC121_g12024 [Phytophthora cactorum]
MEASLTVVAQRQRRRRPCINRKHGSSCGANYLRVGDKRYFVEYRRLTADEREKQHVQGCNGTSARIGIGTIALWVTSVSREQSFNVDYDDEKATYPLSKNLATALQAPLKSKCGLWMFTAHNEFLPGENNPLVPDPMHIRKMDDEGLVEGVMLRRRQLNMCEACQIGKQRAKAGGAQ